MPIQTKSKKKAAPAKMFYTAIFENGTVSDAERARVTKEFAASGAKLVWIGSAQGQVRPSIERHV
jgi:hypothetical protein